MANIDSFAAKEALYPTSLTAEEIEASLVSFGLGPYEVELVMLRFVEEKAMAEIVEIQGWLSYRSACHYLKETLKKLRLGGFKFK